MSTDDTQGEESTERDLFDVSGVARLSDDELLDRRRQIAQIERDEFHRNLNAAGFLAHEALLPGMNAAHLMNEPLDDARRALDEEIRRRGLA